MKTAKFKDSPLGPIPQDWEVKTIAEFGQVVTGSTPPRGDNDNWNGDFPWISAQDFGGKYIRESVEHISEQGKKFCRLVPADSVLVTCIASIGLNAIVKIECATNQQINAVICEKGSPDFLYYTMEFNKARFLALAGQTAVPIINKGQFKTFTVPCPPLEEQQRIAEALGEVDKLIESLDAQIEKKRLIAKGVAHDLLSAKKRLPGFKGAWERVRLGDIGEFYGGLSGKTADDFGHGTARFITFLNVLNNVTIDKDMVGEVDVRFGEKQHAVRKGDLFFNVSSETPEEVAMCAALMEDMPNTYLNSFCCGFRLNKPDHNPLFISYYFNSNIGRDALRGIASGITRYNLSKKAFREKMLVWPECSEQRAIAEVLSEMDASITALEAKREKYAYIKEGMMRDLLTGKVRMKGE